MFAVLCCLVLIPTQKGPGFPVEDLPTFRLCFGIRAGTATNADPVECHSDLLNIAKVRDALTDQIRAPQSEVEYEVRRMRTADIAQSEKFGCSWPAV